MFYRELIERLRSLAPDLPGEERAQGERVLALCQGLEGRTRRGEMLTPEAADLELKRELGRLVELLSRRSAKAVPFAKLGRAALADLAQDLRSARSTLAECEAQLSLLGL